MPPKPAAIPMRRMRASVRVPALSLRELCVLAVRTVQLIMLGMGAAAITVGSLPRAPAPDAARTAPNSGGAYPPRERVPCSVHEVNWSRDAPLGGSNFDHRGLFAFCGGR